MQPMAGPKTISSCHSLLFLVVILVGCVSLTLSELTFDDVPSMDPDQFLSNPEYVKDNYEILREMTEGFVGVVQPNSLNYEMIERAIKQDFSSVQDEILELMEYNVGIVICVLIGLIFVVFMPIVGTIFCCCRCCGKCGGKLEQKETKNKKCKRIYFSIALLIVSAIMGAGMACSNFANERISDGVEQIDDAYNGILTDTSSFMRLFRDQVDHALLSELDNLESSVVGNVKTIDEQVLQPIQKDIIDPVLTPLISSTDDLVSGVNQTEALLSDLDEKLSQLSDFAERLAANLTNSKSEIYQIITSCGSACNSIDTASLQVGIDVDSIPSVGEDLEEINNITEGDFEKYKKGIEEGFDIIEETIQNATADAVNQTEVFFDDIDKSIDDVLSGVDDLIDDANTVIDDLQENDEDAWKWIYQVDEYRRYSCYGITAAVLLLLLLNIGGLALGTCGTKSNIKPTERSQLSNAGGNILMAGVFFTFLFSFIIMIVVTFSFLTFASLDQFCQPLESLELIEKTIDQKGLFVDDGYLLGDAIFQNASIPLKLSEVLEDCKNDSTLYTALKLDHSYPLDDIQKYTSSEELDKITQDLIDELDLNWEINVITPEIEEELKDITNLITDLNFDNITDTLNGSIVETNLTTFADQLDSVAANSSLPNATRQGLTEQANILRTIEKDVVTPMGDLIDEIESEVDQLETVSASITATTDQLLIDAKEAEEVINANSTKETFENLTIEFISDNLNDVAKYGDYLVNQIYHEAGICKPFRNMYDAAVVNACKYGIQSFNLLWFTYGWCLFFFIPSIIYSVKLAKYYRVMDRLASLQSPKRKRKNRNQDQDEEDYEETIGMDAINSQLIVDHRGGGGGPLPYNAGHTNPQYVHGLEPTSQAIVYNNHLSDPPPYSQNSGVQQLDNLLYNNAPKNDSNWKFGS